MVQWDKNGGLNQTVVVNQDQWGKNGEETSNNGSQSGSIRTELEDHQTIVVSQVNEWRAIKQ